MPTELVRILVMCVVRCALCVVRCAFVNDDVLVMLHFVHARPSEQVREVVHLLEQVTNRHHVQQLQQSAWCAWMLHDPSDSIPVSTQRVVDPVHPSSWTPLDGALCVLELSRPVGPWDAHRRRLFLRVRAHLQRYVSFRFLRRLVAVGTCSVFGIARLSLLRMPHHDSSAVTRMDTDRNTIRCQPSGRCPLCELLVSPRGLCQRSLGRFLLSSQLTWMFARKRGSILSVSGASAAGLVHVDEDVITCLCHILRSGGGGDAAHCVAQRRLMLDRAC
jgi:hypothetical protein